MHNTASIVSGWTVGTLVIDQNAWLDVEENLIPINNDILIEIKNGDHWEAINKDILERKTSEGWPVLAGMTARVKLA